MTAGNVEKISDWNKLLDKVNAATQNCGGGSLQHVKDPYLWSASDIKAVQNVLKAGCSTATFTTPDGPPSLWKQKILDEIDAALQIACCNGGGSGPTGPTGPSPVVWYVYLCDCNGSVLLCPNGGCCNECLPWNIPGITGGGNWWVVAGSIKQWAVRQYPNAEALARAYAAFYNASAYCQLGDENGYCTGETAHYNPWHVDTYSTPGLPIAEGAPCVCH